ncbi:MAG: NAD-dependent epimerase/dehydratase family protein, partial [Gemmatimonadales bacterium]
VNDFVAGEIEHAVWSAWHDRDPDVIVIEGQGSLMNPAYPGGFEILAAGRPDVVVLQHAPARVDYDGFPGYPIHPLPRQIEAVELLSGKPVVAIAINHEGLSPEATEQACRTIQRETGLPTSAPLRSGMAPLLDVIQRCAEAKKDPDRAA